MGFGSDLETRRETQTSLRIFKRKKCCIFDEKNEQKNWGKRVRSILISRKVLKKKKKKKKKKTALRCRCCCRRLLLLLLLSLE